MPLDGLQFPTGELSADVKDALQGTQGDPSDTNRYVTKTDVATSGNAGLMSAADKIRLDGFPSQVADATTTITAGDGLTGGGTLAANRTLNVVAANSTITVNADSIQVGTITDTEHSNLSGGTLHAAATTSVNGFMSASDKTKLDGLPSSAVPTTRNLTAGAGLTGGGDLSADRTFNVVAADGSITVNANSIQVGTISDSNHGNRSGGSLHSVATQSVNGFLSAADKTLIDSITTGDLFQTIWAEDNGPLVNGEREWSFGNGSEGVNNVYAAQDGEIKNAFIDAETPGTTASIDIMINDVSAGTASFTSNGLVTLGTPISVSAGDAIGFQTNTVVGTWNDVRVGVGIAQTITGLKGDKGDPGAGTDLVVQKDDSTVGTITETLNFEGNAVTSVTDEGSNKTTALIQVTGTNVDAAGAVMNSDTSTASMAFVNDAATTTTNLWSADKIQEEIDEGIILLTSLNALKFRYYADQLDYPRSSDWAVNNGAPSARDSNNTALTIRRFDDSSEEGVGFSTVFPLLVTDMLIRIKFRALTAPGASAGVVWKLYWRRFPDNGAVTSWSSLQLPTATVPTNTNVQYYSYTAPLTTWGITAGDFTQFELTRVGGNASDTLSGDAGLLSLELEYS